MSITTDYDVPDDEQGEVENDEQLDIELGKIEDSSESKNAIDIYDDDIKNYDRVQLSASAVTINCHNSEIGELISKIEMFSGDTTGLKLELADYLIDETTNRMYKIAENKARMK